MSILIIGAGLSGLSAAIELQSKGFEVIILEKNAQAGGRLSVFEAEGFIFDKGPSWYWMPEVFRHFFEKHGKNLSDYYKIIPLDPAYQVVFSEKDLLKVPKKRTDLVALFEQIEKGSGKKLEQFLAQAKYKYEVSMNEFVFKPSLKWSEYLDIRLLKSAFTIDLFQSFQKHVRKFFKDSKLLKIIEFPVLFLGATPENTPAMYSLMNHADLDLGTWYPEGGMYEITKAFVKLAHEKGVKILYNQEVESFFISEKKCKGVKTKTGDFFDCEAVVASADYQHIEKLLGKEANYSEKYWDSRVLAPSCLLFYVGVNRKVDYLIHHTLFFDKDFSLHVQEIYTTPKYPSDPLFYVCCPSKTDAKVAPKGCENLFILIPIAPDLEDNEEIRESYFMKIINELERFCKHPIHEHIIYKKSYSIADFKTEYNAFKGNAYGLANTLLQTGPLKPSIQNKKIPNIFYTGQLTVPGPGMPPSIISGQIVAAYVYERYKK